MCRKLVAICVGILAIFAGSLPADSIRILPLGDSITQGGRKIRAEYTYRFPLQKMLIDGHYDTQFIGSMNTGLDPDFKWPDINGKSFQMNHEGHYGWKTAAVRDHLADWMKTYPHPADIVLIHLGTNDQDAAKNATDKDQRKKLYQKTITEPLTDIIKMLREKNPNVVVLVGHLNFNGGSALEIRPLVDQMAMEVSNERSPVITVATYQGWHEDPKLPDTDTFDWAHPNPQGQAKLAKAYFDVMKPYLDRLQKQSPP